MSRSSTSHTETGHYKIELKERLKEKLKEAVSAVLPIIIIVLALCFTIVPISLALCWNISSSRDAGDRNDVFTLELRWP